MKVNLKFLKQNRGKRISGIAALGRGMAILLLLVTSCQLRPQLKQFQTVDEEGWGMNDTLFFDVDSIFDDGLYTLSIGVRVSASHPYPYRDITMEVCQSRVGQSEPRIDTVACDLSELLQSGEQHGVSVYSFEQNLDTLQLHHGDSVRIAVRHLMRRNPLPGIRDVGVILQH